jgi:hypothetical protein
MEYAINEELIHMINDGTLGLMKIRSLMSLKEFIDGISEENFLDDFIVNKVSVLHDKKPAVITWGDYYQTKIAYEFQCQSDEKFIRAVESIKFDLISSFDIFSDKTAKFFEWVESNLLEKSSKKNYFSREEYDETIHVNLLKDDFNSDESYNINSYKRNITV